MPTWPELVDVIDDKTRKNQIEASVVVSQNLLEPNLKRNRK